MKIECTENEKKILARILEDNCPFQRGTVLTCGEDARCSECIEDNIEFIIVEPECKMAGGENENGDSVYCHRDGSIEKYKMREMKFKAYIKHLDRTVPVERINFDCKTVEVDLTDGNGDFYEYDFDEIELMQYIDSEDKKGMRSIQKDIHENAKNHGWWDENRTFGEIIALCHSELSEALEEYRNHHKATEIYYQDGKPEGIPVELADIIIRILDYCEKEDIDMGEAIRIKHEYNKTRPYKHGGKVI